MNGTCLNSYQSSDVFFEKFGNDDEELRKCEKCPSLTYEDGVMSCSMFNDIPKKSND